MQKTYAGWNLLRICIQNVTCKMHFWWFVCLDAFHFRIFAKMRSLKPEAHFWKPTLSNQPSKIHFLELWMPWIEDKWAIFLALIALLPVRFALFRLRSPIRILIFDWKIYIFCLWGQTTKRQQVSHLRIYENFKYCCEFALKMYFAKYCLNCFLLCCMMFSYFC